MDETKIQNSFNKVKEDIKALRIMGVFLGVAIIIGVVGLALIK